MKSAAGDHTQRATEHANDDDFQFQKTKWEKKRRSVSSRSASRLQQQYDLNIKWLAANTAF